MACHYSDLGGVSDWSCRVGNLVQPIMEKHYLNQGSDTSRDFKPPYYSQNFTRRQLITYTISVFGGLQDRPDRALYQPPRKGHLEAEPRSTANFAGKEKEKKEKEITSSVTGTGEKKPQVGESSKESGKDEKENSHYQRVQRVRNKVSDFVRNSYGDSCEV